MTPTPTRIQRYRSGASSGKRRSNWQMLVVIVACFSLGLLCGTQYCLLDYTHTQTALASLPSREPGWGGANEDDEEFRDETLPELFPIPSYPLRDLDEYKRRTAPAKIPTNSSQCMKFRCNKDVDACDNANPTDYDGNKPPCCVHILRDMADAFDQEMAIHGLDYAVGFGHLLGLWRSDRLIPWTGDDDIYIPSEAVMWALLDLWNASRTGLAPLFQDIHRMCATKDFADGKLANWEIPRFKPEGDISHNLDAYLDLYGGTRKLTDPNTNTTYFRTISQCLHGYVEIFPSKRMKFYNNTLAQNVPAKPVSLLNSLYGKDWRIPSSDRKKDNGGNHRLCPYNIDNWVFRKDGNDIDGNHIATYTKGLVLIFD